MNLHSGLSQINALGIVDRFITVGLLIAVAALGVFAARRGRREHLAWIVPLASAFLIRLISIVFAHLWRLSAVPILLYLIETVLYLLAIFMLIVVVRRSLTRPAAVVQPEPPDEGAWPPPPRS